MAAATAVDEAPPPARFLARSAAARAASRSRRAARSSSRRRAIETQRRAPSDGKSLLEIGVKHGASLKSWAGYIPDAAIHGMDSSKKIAYQCRKENGEPKTECLGFPNIEIDYTDQNSKEQLKNSIGEKMFDLIIDDGGHKVDQQ